jgi:hypothetical protein
MFGDLINQLFCVEDTDSNGSRRVRVSLTKTGAACKTLSASICAGFGTVAFNTHNHSAMVIAVTSAVLACVGAFFEKIGERNAMNK